MENNQLLPLQNNIIIKNSMQIPSKIYRSMMKVFLAMSFSFVSFVAMAQDCNQLGVWMWHFEITEFASHEDLADSLATMGIKRIYAKVADGSLNPSSWPEVIDTSMVAAYHGAGLEIWAWSYNYPGNSAAQAAALYEAARTGYDGYVVDVEMQFDGEPEAAENLFAAFDQARHDAISDEIASETFALYCTTWGNPADHNFPISSINPYVDAFMPQTYVEIWGQSFIDDLTFWIEEGDREYEALGSTRPNHHIVAMEKDIISGAEVNEFILASGPETSIWRIPGGGTPMSIWEQWDVIDWSIDFCNIAATDDINGEQLVLFPNPTSGLVHWSSDLIFHRFEVYSASGELIKRGIVDLPSLDLSGLGRGSYAVRLVGAEGVLVRALVIF